ncbi:hypothetical protein B0I35DRAFT_61126 [Stachybotrys elegans]|uniref:Uncharacterized protein n=1 Tax=Stachybotrys elegans TaxID=80388 RepID=A0A8K0WQK9_9HYPO|nr:hypothetical protein B0I35DRAFT_61126 [Stachybotrys elegans]
MSCQCIPLTRCVAMTGQDGDGGQRRPSRVQITDARRSIRCASRGTTLASKLKASQQLWISTSTPDKRSCCRVVYQGGRACSMASRSMCANHGGDSKPGSRNKTGTNGTNATSPVSLGQAASQLTMRRGCYPPSVHGGSVERFDFWPHPRSSPRRYEAFGTPHWGVE